MRAMSSAPAEIDTIPASLWPPEGDTSIWHYNPNWEASEKHWLSCGVVMPKYAKCNICGERELDD